MKKTAALIFFVLGITVCFAGDFSYSGYGNHFSYTEEKMNLLYLSAAGTDKKGKLDFEKIINAAVYDITSNKTSYIFPKDNKEIITLFMFEKEIDNKKNTVLFNHNADSYTKNNINITRKNTSNHLIIKTENLKTGQTTFWLCLKDGSGLKHIYKHSKTDNVRMFINTKELKIVFIKQTGMNLEFQEIDY